MKRKLLALLLVLTMLIPYVPYEPVHAAGVIGTSGSIPAGGNTGSGGGVSLIPSFRVGLISEEFRIPLDNSGSSTITDQILQHYVNHFPRLENSLIFSPSRVYTDRSESLIGWYNASNGNLNCLEDLTQDPDGRYIADKKLRRIDEDNYANPSDPNVFYNSLLGKLVDDEFKSLGNGAWKDVLDETADSETKSMKVWSYLLKDWDNTAAEKIDIKLEKYTHYTPDAETNAQKRLENQVGYLDILMTLYVLSHDDQRLFYEAEIERYIKGQEVATRPPLIAIDTVVSVSVPAYTTKKVFISSLDYIQYIAGITPENNFFNPNAPAFPSPNTQPYVSNHSHTVIANLTNRSMDQLPSRPRVTSLPYGDAYNNNGFAWGQAGVSGSRLRTHLGTAVWDSSSVTGVMESLIFEGSHYGFIIVAGAENVLVLDPSPNGEFEIITYAPDPELLTEGSTQLGEMVTVTLKGKLQSSEEEDWQKLIDTRVFDPGYPQIKVDLKSTTLAAGQADTSNTYTLSTAHTYKGNATWLNTTPEQLMSFLKGNNQVDFTHNLMSFPVTADASYTFNYTATVEVKLGPDPEDLITLTGNPGSADKTFYNPPILDLPLFGSYTSTPFVYSEIKQGSPGNETFEAMAGTPTTRNLYFASGGSEFIVEIVTKYYPDQESVRTYKSWYAGTPSEFKAGDRAGNYSVGGYSINGHSGGERTKTWTGRRPWTGSVSYYDHGGSATNSWSDTAYNAALAEAQAYADQVNATVVSHTAASDGITRNFNGWGASVSSSKSRGAAGWYDPGQPYIAPSYDTDSEGNTVMTSPGQPYRAARGANGTAGRYTITVTFSMPAHAICGPEHNHDLPAIQDTWKQRITYDIQKIEKVNVWKIDRSHVDGMVRLIGTDEVVANVVQGDPNVFYNIAATETSADGRLRYTLEPQQHDTVVWYEGIRSNKSDGMGTNPAAVQSPVSSPPGHSASYATGILYTNSGYTEVENYHISNSDAKDKATPEYAKFNQRRTTLNTATVISDFVILQTSSGDQSLIYFDKNSTPKEAQQHFDKVVNTKVEMWDNNSESAAQWGPDAINIGSYNGNYYSPSTKYTGTGDNRRTYTRVDSDPANTISRPARPSNLRLVETGLDVIDTILNGEYITGQSKVFYEHLLSYGGSGSLYVNSHDADFGASGLVFEAPYSDNHSKVNDIVIHNPVSAQYAAVLPVDNSLDQRSAGSVVGGNLQPDTQEYAETDFTPGSLLVVDNEFQVYFPNEGDFYGDGSYGISGTTSQRGKGFTDNMDTTEWTAKKVVKFEYNVIYDGVLYPEGVEIELPVDQELYDFYLPLANKEAISAGVEFYAIANNGGLVDNSSPTNRTRYSNKNAKHSAFKMYNIDLVGRIGNLVMVDTGDFRFSNLFKDPVIPTQWFIPNVVPFVELDQQNQFLGSSSDIRGLTANASTDFLNTYGSLDFLEQAPLRFPLSPSMNNIAALQRQPLRIGYPMFLDIQTVGNYYGNMQIIPYYYRLDLTTGNLTPVDVYMKVDSEYGPINLFGAAVPGWDPTSVYNYQMQLNWDDEAARRNYHVEERTITEYVRDNTYNVNSAGTEVLIGMPMGKYHIYGNAQIMYPNDRNRTFIGTSRTYGENKNPGGVLTEYEFNKQAQRYHFGLKLPSSAVFVPSGSQPTQANIDSIMNNTSVIIASADIKAVGDTYVLQYEHPGGNGTVTVAGTTHSLASIPYSVLAVYSANKSSADDLDSSGTH